MAPQGMLALILATWFWGLTSAYLDDKEYISNNDFELDFTKDWPCYTACSAEVSTDSYSGLYSAKVSQRVGKSSSIRHIVDLDTPGGTFYVTARLKLANELLEQFPMGHTLDLSVAYPTAGKTERTTIAKVPRVKMHDGWVQLGGDFRLPDDSYKVTIYAYPSDDPAIDYFIDSASLRMFNSSIDSVPAQNARIEELRKGDLELLIITPAPNDFNKVTVELEQIKHEFPFGMAVEGWRLWSDDPINEQYKNYVFDNFNWVTLANVLKWRIMESSEDQPRFTSAHKALAVLKEHNIPVRGHCVSWGKETKIMDWLQQKDVLGVKEAVKRRIEYLISEFNTTTIKHWDVINENLHGSWYEEATHNDQFLQSMFNQMHDLDPSLQLFMNDYDVMSLSLFTSAYRNFGMKLRMNGVPISAMGMQSHLSVYPDPDLLEKRLDVLAEAGLPLWITELDVRQEDLNLRAQGYEDALRLYFSHPAVEGIIIWGFYDQGLSYTHASLVDGENFQENEAGRRVRHLLKHEWHTQSTHTPTSAVEAFSERAFYGTYQLNLRYRGEVIYNGTLEHSSKDPQRYFLTVDSNLPADQIFRTSG